MDRARFLNQRTFLIDAGSVFYGDEHFFALGALPYAEVIVMQKYDVQALRPAEFHDGIQTLETYLAVLTKASIPIVESTFSFINVSAPIVPWTVVRRSISDPRCSERDQAISVGVISLSPPIFLGRVLPSLKPLIHWRSGSTSDSARIAIAQMQRAHNGTINKIVAITNRMFYDKEWLDDIATNVHGIDVIHGGGTGTRLVYNALGDPVVMLDKPSMSNIVHLNALSSTQLVSSAIGKALLQR